MFENERMGLLSLENSVMIKNVVIAEIKYKFDYNKKIIKWN